MRKVLFFFLVGVLFVFRLFVVPQVFSDELDDINKKLTELQSALSASQKATAPLESQLNSLQKQLKGIEDRVAFVERDLAEKKKIIDQGYRDLEKNKNIFNKTVRDYYIKSYFLSPLLVFISQADAAQVTRIIIYQKRDADRDKDAITQIALKIVGLEERKAKLEEEEAKLAGIKEKLAQEKGEIEKVVKGAKDYQASLSSEIAKLSARQKEILGQRLAALNIPRSAATALAGCTDDRGKDPGFSPRIAFFTYGVPNRTGLNQYGADGRARAGQSVEQILEAYYTSYELKKDFSTDININVDGYGSYNIEEYVKRIYEMPSNFAMEALKAQAVAARSYALAYTNNGAGSICTTQSCQVFQPGPKGGAWEEAVNATRGWVMVQGGTPIKAWYSSTHGGYILSTSELPGWSATSWTKHATDTTSGAAGSFSELQSNAYDRESPWFYCDWGSRASYNKTAWLKTSEVADIVNVILLAKADSSIGEHIYQTDKPNPAGTDTWDESRVRQELQNRGITPFNNVSNVSIDVDFSGGRTTSVNVSGDAGSQSFSGDEFKNWFNLRAPANIQIVGPLYNTEKQ
ncbi:MAG: SpoIID/LytB domain-containing protein [Candidatus Levybacteria bacterium]|nr:SpoIID/LytB domain-containing protein [Candidatus Levybacteria bacterium]